MRNFLRSAILFAALALVPACEDDPVTPETPPVHPPQLMPLTSREAVLNNIEYAYNNRRIDPIDALLDAEFTFFFASGDVGGSIPPQWGRADELQVTYYLFMSNNQPVPIGPVCRSIKLDVRLEDGVEWTPITPGGYPSETWYSAEVHYSFTIEAEPDMTFISQLGTMAQFTVREVGAGDVAHWQLVEWRDRGATRSNLLAFEIDTNTWGLVKALYH